MESGILVAALLGALCLSVALYIYLVGIKVSTRRQIANLQLEVDLADAALADKAQEIEGLRVDLISATDLALQSDTRVKTLTGSVDMLEEDNERKEAALSTIAKASSSKNGTARRLARIAKTALAA